MNICEKENKVNKPPVLIMGHVYKLTSQYANGLYICAYGNRLINLKDGGGCAGEKGYGSLTGEGYSWEDVTDKYCLKEI